MSSTVSSIFSTEISTSQTKRRENLRIDDFLTAPATLTRKNAPIFASALNICYQNSLLRLKENLDELDESINESQEEKINSFNIIDDDFQTTIFSDRNYSPKILTISEWRHDASMTDRFVLLMQKFVGENLYSIVLNLIELELNNEEERKRKSNQRKNDFEKKIYRLREMKNSIDFDQLYEISEVSKEILFEKIDWKLIGTLMRKHGNFKYFDEFILKRFWIHRCQYPVKSSWSNDEDRRLDELVGQNGFGRWNEIAQDEIFQKNRKSPLMCAQRYMTRLNQNYGDRPFTEEDKDQLISIHKYRCSVWKDYRFSISYASYFLVDRSTKKISQVWTRLDPDIRYSSFSADEDAHLLRYGSKDAKFSWRNFLPERSANQCRRRYFQLMKPEKKKKNSSKEKLETNVNS